MGLPESTSDIPIIFNAYVATDGAILDANGRLYGGIRSDMVPTVGRPIQKLAFIAVPWLANGFTIQLPSRERLLRLCASLAPNGGLATYASVRPSTPRESVTPRSFFTHACHFQPNGHLVNEESWFYAHIVLLANPHPV